MTMGCPLQLRERMGGELTRASKTVTSTVTALTSVWSWPYPWTRESSSGRVLLFVVDGRHLTERGVPSVRVVPGLDEVEDGHPSLGLISEALPL